MVVAIAWAGALALLAALWVRSPISGPGRMFVAWSVPALALTLFTSWWLGQLTLVRLRPSRALMGAVIGLWASATVITLAGAGAEWALDGFILRRPLQRAVGIGIVWLPGLFGLTLSVAGLAAALEARYRIAHGEAAELGPTGP